MFTGLVEEVGTIASIAESGGNHRITINAPSTAKELNEGNSVAVSGVCLTALNPDPVYFYADLAQETSDRTSLRALAPGAKVNLEMPTAAGSPLGDHVVQGHVDGTGVLLSINSVNPPASSDYDVKSTDWTLKVEIPKNLRKWMVSKASVALEGISLTIADVDVTSISIAILPLTYWRTNLHTLAPGATVNIEADMLVKLAHARMEEQCKPAFELTGAWLVANGY